MKTPEEAFEKGYKLGLLDTKIDYVKNEIAKCKQENKLPIATTQRSLNAWALRTLDKELSKLYKEREKLLKGFKQICKKAGIN